MVIENIAHNIYKSINEAFDFNDPDMSLTDDNFIIDTIRDREVRRIFLNLQKEMYSNRVLQCTIEQQCLNIYDTDSNSTLPIILSHTVTEKLREYNITEYVANRNITYVIYNDYDYHDINNLKFTCGEFYIRYIDRDIFNGDIQQILLNNVTINADKVSFSAHNLPITLKNTTINTKCLYTTMIADLNISASSKLNCQTLSINHTKFAMLDKINNLKIGDFRSITAWNNFQRKNLKKTHQIGFIEGCENNNIFDILGFPQSVFNNLQFITISINDNKLQHIGMILYNKNTLKTLFPKGSGIDIGYQCILSDGWQGIFCDNIQYFFNRV